VDVKDLLRRVEQAGWCLSRHTGELFEPDDGYLVPMSCSTDWWRVHARHLRADVVKLYVYTHAPDFRDDPCLFLYVAKTGDGYSLGMVRHETDRGIAQRLADRHGCDVIYRASGHRPIAESFSQADAA
jgi:hypothetical protein